MTFREWGADSRGERSSVPSAAMTAAAAGRAGPAGLRFRGRGRGCRKLGYFSGKEVGRERTQDQDGGGEAEEKKERRAEEGEGEGAGRGRGRRPGGGNFGKGPRRRGQGGCGRKGRGRGPGRKGCPEERAREKFLTVGGVSSRKGLQPFSV